MAALIIAAMAHADPMSYQCSPLPLDNPEWVITYNYSIGDGVLSGGDTLFIGQIDKATNSVIPGHMEMRSRPPQSDGSVLFSSDYEPDYGFKMIWTTTYNNEVATNEITVPSGVNTNAAIGDIQYSVVWKKGVEQGVPCYRRQSAPQHER